MSMTMDNHVGLEAHICVVCGEQYDTGAILLATKYKKDRDGDLAPVKPIEQHHVTGTGVCPEHQKQIDEGFVLFVEMQDEPANGTHYTNEEFLEARRTGLMVGIKRDVLPNILQNVDFDNIPSIAACAAGFVALIEERTGGSLPTDGEVPG